MSKQINELVYNSRQILKAAEEYQTEFVPYGINSNYLNEMKAETEKLSSFDNEYFTKENMKKDLTRTVEEFDKLVKRDVDILKNFAKFRIKDSKALDQFMVGKSSGNSFSARIIDAEKVYKTSKEYESQLKSLDFDIRVINRLSESIEKWKQADSQQEAMKKNLKKLHQERDIIAQEVNKKIQFIQKIALSLFRENHAVKDRFFHFIIEKGASEASTQATTQTQPPANPSTVSSNS